MNTDGTGQTQLTFDAADHDQLPEWSPDGTKIAYEDDASGNGDIYVMNADGTDQHDLSNNAASEFGPAWSPDGSSIAFISDRSGTRLVWVMNADGSSQHPLTGGPDKQYVPAWQPRGARLIDVSS